MREHVFEGERAFDQCHASTLVVLEGGRILAAWFGGTREGHADVAVWGARREGGRWSPPRRLAKVRGSAHWNPVLFHAPDGLLHLFFKVGDRIPDWEMWRTVSADAGETWTEPRELTCSNGARCLGPDKNKPIVLSDDTCLAPASIERHDGSWDVFVTRSGDGGRTWEAMALVPLDRSRITGRGVIQPTLWESEPGCVHMLMRSSCGRICRSDSEDGGRTWSPVRKTQLPGNNSGIDLARLRDGTLALAFNPVSGDWAPRTPLSLALSTDDGRTWPRRVDVETGAGEYSYPAIVPTGEGIALTYTWRRERIGFWAGAVSGPAGLRSRPDAG